MVARGDEVPLSDYQEERWRPGQILGSSLGLLGTTLYQPSNFMFHDLCDVTTYYIQLMTKISGREILAP